MPVLLGGLTGSLLLGGCGTLHDDSAAQAAARFYEAVAQGDGEGACRLLTTATRSELVQSSQKPCEQAVLGAGIPKVGTPVGVSTYETMGQVRYQGETAFLVRTGSRWRVMAAGCTPQSRDLPYDCKVKGG